jgi:hypothetical protein
MARTQRISGNLTLDPTGDLIVSADTQITGNLTVVGTTTTFTTTDVAIKDRVIVLNNGETGAGVTGRYSGIEVERGSTNNAFLVFDENDDTFKISTDGGSSYTAIVAGGLANVVQDTTPQLGGNLDVNGNSIISVSNGDVAIAPNGSGNFRISSPIRLDDEGSAPSSVTGATLMYSATAGGGGSGIFFVDGSINDELVSKSKAIVYGLIF